MSAQSYIKFWTAEPSEHEEVQAYDLLGYEYDFRKETTSNGKVTGKTYGGKIRVSIAGFPTEELLEWMFNSRILKDGEVMNTSGLPGTPKEIIRFKEQNALSSTYIQQPKRAVYHYSSTSGKWRPAIRVT